MLKNQPKSRYGLINIFLKENSLIYSFQWQHRMAELSSNAIILMWFQTCQRSYIRKLYNTNCKKSCIVNFGKTKKKHKVKPKSHFEKYILEYNGLSVLFLFHLLCRKTALILIFVSLNKTLIKWNSNFKPEFEGVWSMKN